VNANDDVLLGFSMFSSATFPSAGYAFRSSTDAAGSMRTPVMSKAGEGYYYKTFGGTRNRWGDYSHTQVDPSNDLSLWTVQEYSKPVSGTTSKWSTWWIETGPDPFMAIDPPPAGPQYQPFSLTGWAIDRGGSETGVTTVHVWAYGSGGATFVGAATYGQPRSDVAAAYGGNFTNSGFSVTVSGLPSGAYTLVAYAYSNLTNSFNQWRGVPVTISAAGPFMGLEAPVNGAMISSPISGSGWAIDTTAATGTGVDAVHIWAFPASGPAVFVGAASYGSARSDIAATYGNQFLNSGFSFSGSLPAGSYNLIAYARSTVAGAFNNWKAASITVTAPVSDPQMAIDIPPAGSVQTRPFTIAGWAIDRGAPTGTGVDAVHVYAFPSGGGPPTFVGAATYGVTRSDVGAYFGARFTDSGYTISVTSAAVPAGDYVFSVYAHSTIAGFNQVRAISVTVH
jgi:hypothetical protein